MRKPLTLTSPEEIAEGVRAIRRHLQRSVEQLQALLASEDPMRAFYRMKFEQTVVDPFWGEPENLLEAVNQCQLRRDYVQGAGSSPVGYLEGIFVREEYRRRGHARELLAACQAWAAEQGCREFASDCELDNQASYRFHRAAGFAEAGRIICFIKKL